jgi:hypothetical protein
MKSPRDLLRRARAITRKRSPEWTPNLTSDEQRTRALSLILKAKNMGREPTADEIAAAKSARAFESFVRDPANFTALAEFEQKAGRHEQAARWRKLAATVAERQTR